MGHVAISQLDLEPNTSGARASSDSNWQAAPTSLAVQTSSSSSSRPLTLTQGQHVDVTNLTVVDPLGEQVVLGNGTNQTISRNGAGFSGVAIFDAAEPG
jgi:hypothetical protein